MKKTGYLVLITLLTVGCIIGGMLYHSGGLQGFWPDARVSGKTETIFQENGEVTAIALNSEVMDVKIRTGEKLEVAYGGNANLKPEVSLDGGTLTITQRGKVKNSFNLFNIGKNTAKLEVTIPSDAKITKFTSQIDICDMEIAGFSAEDAEIHGNVGDIDVNGAAFGSSVITLNTGDLDVEKTALGSGTISVNTGDIDVKQSAFGNLNVTGDVGDIDVELTEDRQAYAIDLSTDIGDVEVFGDDEGKSFSQQGSGSSSPSLTVKNHIGDIKVK